MSLTEEERKWAHEQIEQYIQVYPRYKKYAETLQKVLECVVKKDAPLSIVQTRPKSIVSFADKMWRKKKEGRYMDSVNQMTDLCGGRVITPTRSDMNAVCDFIIGHFEIDEENSFDVSKRMKPAEFGYRSVHYIVKFKKGVFPTKDIDVEIPGEVFCLKAEIQVRTILEHAWAIFSHDRSYKGAFAIPNKWERELATLAATLESADSTFSRIQTSLQAYAASYDAYMTKERIRDEIAKLEITLEHDPENIELIHRIGKMAMVLGDWQKALGIFSEHISSDYQPLLRDLGVAMCKLYDKGVPEYRQGQKYLERACELSIKDIDALCSLAGTWKDIKDDEASKYYRKALEIDPTNPYPLDNYMIYDIVNRQNTHSVLLMGNTLQTAIERCRDQADVSMNLPWAFSSMGLFYLLIGKPYESLAAYAKAIQGSLHYWMIEDSLETIDKLSVVGDSINGYEWVRRLLLVGLGAFPNPKNEVREEMKKLATGYGPISGPVVIVVGGCDNNYGQQIQSYQDLLLATFKGFKGTIISCGITGGVSGLIGDVQQEHRDTIKTIGYIPLLIPPNTAIDTRYSEIRYTKGTGFSALEPVQKWIDIITSGIDPGRVKVLGIDGGIIEAVEYRIALALGASVGVIKGSGYEVERLLMDNDWNDSKKLAPLPANPMIAGSFIRLGRSELPRDVREIIAQAIHENHLRLRSKSTVVQDPSMVEWVKLIEYLKESNRQQADDIIEKLQKIGCEAHRVADREIALMKFTDKEIEILAEMEHARWVVECLFDGWTFGEKRDVLKKTSPYLVDWSELSEDMKEWDRETVRKIPEFLANVGLEVRRGSQ